ncbi:hypothetical protein [Metabacillus halosaccharovorans]|uniref:hypothetical protein n=1 Tax=Metabacillus halosaccharovorans TaxID=930124 RepID=UPI001C1F74AC|nr:hypothetical protein [Metabacillus halosaccharovorans]
MIFIFWMLVIMTVVYTGYQANLLRKEKQKAGMFGLIILTILIISFSFFVKIK